MLAHDGAAGAADSDEEDDDATPMVLPLLLLLLLLHVSAAAAAAAVGGSLVSEWLGVLSDHPSPPPDAREVAVLPLWELGEKEGWTTTDWGDADEGDASSPSS